MDFEIKNMSFFVHTDTHICKIQIYKLSHEIFCRSKILAYEETSDQQPTLKNVRKFVNFRLCM